MLKKDGGRTRCAGEQLQKILRNLRKLLYSYRSVEKSACEDMVEVIDNLLQTKNAETVEAALLDAITQAIEVLAVFIEEGAGKSAEESSDRDLFVVGKVLDRTYIESTEIEQAQFFVKEIALRIEAMLLAKRFQPRKEEPSLNTRADTIFSEIRTNCAKYFRENAREMEGKHSTIFFAQDERLNPVAARLEAMKAQGELLSATLANLLSPEGPKDVPEALESPARELLLQVRRELDVSTRPVLASIKEMQQHIRANISDFDRSLQHIKAIAGQRNNGQERLRELAHALQEKEEQCEALTAFVAELRRHKEGLEGRVASLDKELLKTRQRLDDPATLRARRGEETAEVERLKQLLREDSKTIQELIGKYEAKVAEVNELSSFKEKYASARDENARLSSARGKLEEDYLLFHEELKRVKERIKMLLLQNDNLIGENVIYESKVETLEGKLAELLARKRNSSTAGRSAKTAKSTGYPEASPGEEQNVLSATLRKKDAARNSAQLNSADAPSHILAQDYANKKILKFSS